MTQPSPQDIANAETRAAIAARFRAEYLAAKALCEQALGPGWEPTGRYYLIDNDHADRCHRTGEKPTPAATVLTARNEAGEKRFVALVDGVPTEVPTMEARFGEMLFEPHPSKRFVVAGKEVAAHRFSLCWGWYEGDYRPQTAEQLAVARGRREQKAVEREAEGNLFADAVRAEGFVTKPRRGR